MARTTAVRVLVLVSGLLLAGTALAYDSLFAKLPARGDLSALFQPGSAFARVQDGLLLGEGREHTERLPSGHVRFVREKTYRHVRHPETGALVKLEPPWRVRSTLELSPTLRLLRDHTTLELHALADRELQEHFGWLFEFDDSRTQANATGTRLTRELRRGGRVVERESYAYPRDAIAFEILGVVIAAAVQHGVDHFDFDLLLPGGSTHGVRCDVRRVTRIGALADGYRVPTGAIERQGPLAIAQLRLASPFKRVFYPHEFFFAYSAREPAKLLALWGGDPDENLQAFRVEK